MKNYFKRLKEHPGLEVAIFVTILGFLAGATNKHIEIWWHGGIFGMLFVGIPAWLLVLVTNREK